MDKLSMIYIMGVKLLRRLTKVDKKLSEMGLEYELTILNGRGIIVFTDILGEEHVVYEARDKLDRIWLNNRKGFSQDRVVSWLEGHKNRLTKLESAEAYREKERKLAKRYETRREPLNEMKYLKNGYQLRVSIVEYTDRVWTLSGNGEEITSNYMEAYVVKKTKNPYTPTISVDNNKMYDNCVDYSFQIHSDSYGNIALDEAKYIYERMRFAIEAIDYFLDVLNMQTY